MRNDFAGLASATDGWVSSHVEKLVKKLLAVRKKIKRDILSLLTTSKGDVVADEVGNAHQGDTSAQFRDDALPKLAASRLDDSEDDADDDEEDDSSDTDENKKKEKDWLLPLTIALYLLLRVRILAIAVDSYAKILEDYGFLVSSEIWEKTRDHLHLDIGSDPGQVPEEPPSSLHEETVDSAKSISETIVARDITKLIDILDQAHKDGKTVQEIKKLLADAFDEGITSELEDGEKRTVNPDSFFEMIGRTELHGIAVDTQIHLFRSALIYRTVKWSSVSPCDECLALEGSVWLLDDPSRPSIPLHPNCRCGWEPTTA